MMGLYVKSPNHVNWQSNVMEFCGQGEKQGFSVHFTLCQFRGDEILQSIWKQHTDEMELFEGNVFIVSNK